MSKPALAAQMKQFEGQRQFDAAALAIWKQNGHDWAGACRAVLESRDNTHLERVGSPASA